MAHCQDGFVAFGMDDIQQTHGSPLGIALRRSIRDDWTGHGLDVVNLTQDGSISKWNATKRSEDQPELELKPGDRVMEVNKYPVKTLDDFRRQLESSVGKRLDFVAHRRLGGMLAVGGVYRVESAFGTKGPGAGRLQKGEQVTVVQVSSTNASVRPVATASNAAGTVSVLSSNFCKLRIVAAPGVEQRITFAEQRRSDLESQVSRLSGVAGRPSRAPSQTGRNPTLLDRFQVEQDAVKKLEEEIRRLEEKVRQG